MLLDLVNFLEIGYEEAKHPLNLGALLCMRKIEIQKEELQIKELELVGTTKVNEQTEAQQGPKLMPNKVISTACKNKNRHGMIKEIINTNKEKEKK